MSTLSEKEFTEIFRIYYKEVCLFLNYYTHDRHLIEEVVQDVFFHLWKERENRSIRHIKTYLLTGARNRMLNALRNDKNRELLLSRWAEEELRQKNQHDCIDRDHFLNVLSYAVEQLPDRCRETFLLRYHEELTYQQIAEKQNVSVKTVENQLTTSLKRIREYILRHTSRSHLRLWFLL